MATHSSLLAWRFHGRISLVGYSPLGHKESDMPERLSKAQHVPVFILGTKALTINKTECLSSQKLTISRKMPGNKYFKK